MREYQCPIPAVLHQAEAAAESTTVTSDLFRLFGSDNARRYAAIVHEIDAGETGLLTRIECMSHRTNSSAATLAARPPHALYAVHHLQKVIPQNPVCSS